jgi:hypothetical protein
MVAGTWELTRDGGVAIELRPFRRLTRQVRDDLVSEAERVLGLLAPEADRRVRVAA